MGTQFFCSCRLHISSCVLLAIHLYNVLFVGILSFVLLLSISTWLRLNEESAMSSSKQMCLVYEALADSVCTSACWSNRHGYSLSKAAGDPADFSLNSLSCAALTFSTPWEAWGFQFRCKVKAAFKKPGLSSLPQLTTATLERLHGNEASSSAESAADVSKRVTHCLSPKTSARAETLSRL